MADILITSTGRVFKQIDGTLAAVLLEMFPAAVERVQQNYNAVPEAPTNRHAPRFFVGKGLQSGKVQLRMNIGHEELFYMGPPAYAANAFGGGLRTPPADVIAQYEAALKGIPDPITEWAKRDDARSMDPNVATNPQR
jgi:hypothetical protein